jgi:hypothetical protein
VAAWERWHRSAASTLSKPSRFVTRVFQRTECMPGWPPCWVASQQRAKQQQHGEMQRARPHTAVWPIGRLASLCHCGVVWCGAVPSQVKCQADGLAAAAVMQQLAGNGAASAARALYAGEGGGQHAAAAAAAGLAVTVMPVQRQCLCRGSLQMLAVQPSLSGQLLTLHRRVPDFFPHAWQALYQQRCAACWWAAYTTGESQQHQ